MFRKKDLLIVLLALLLAGAAYGFMVWARGGQALSGMVEIYANGTLWDTVSLAETRDVIVEQDNGDVNIVSVGGGSVRMAFSSCKNQLCLHQGEVSPTNWTGRAMGRSIICLPNRVLVELSLDDSAQRIIDEDLPDV